MIQEYCQDDYHGDKVTMRFRPRHSFMLLALEDTRHHHFSLHAAFNIDDLLYYSYDQDNFSDECLL